MNLQQQYFDRPQKQSVWGIVVNALVFAQEVLRAVAIPLVIVFIKGKPGFYTYFAFGLALMLVVALLMGYLYYKNFSFTLNTSSKHFSIQKGIFSKKNLTIPLDKIQHVQLKQSFVQRVIGVYTLEIDTAGTEKTEIKIPSIAKAMALDFKENLLSGGCGQDSLKVSPQKQTTQAPQTVLKLDTETLIRVGLTSHYGQSLALLFSFVVATTKDLNEVYSALFSQNEYFTEILLKSSLSILVYLLLLSVLILVLLCVNLMRSLLKYYRFELRQQNEDLSISSGLFTRKNTLLNPAKVQILCINQNYLQKKFSISNLNIRQAHGGKSEDQKELSSHNLDIPGCSPSEQDRVLNLLLAKIPKKEKAYQPNIRFLALASFIKICLPILAFMVFIHYSYPNYPYSYLIVLVYALVAFFMLYRSYRKHRLYVDENYIIKQEGIWDISTIIVEVHKIQSITVSQYPWHKALDIGHLSLHTAAGSVRFLYGNFSQIKSLTNLWLYRVEADNKNWM